MSRRIHVLLLAIALVTATAVIRAERHVITQKAKTFNVTALTVKVGDEVVFENNDDITHNIFTNSDGNAFNLRTQAPGTASSHVFEKEGVAEIRCAFHPRMRLTVTIRK